MRANTDRGAWLGVVLLLLGMVGYPASYLLVRFTHVLVHGSTFISEEGWNAHRLHTIDAPPTPMGRELETVYRPLIAVEAKLHEEGLLAPPPELGE